MDTLKHELTMIIFQKYTIEWQNYHFVQDTHQADGKTPHN